jgi:hypothetical protein
MKNALVLTEPIKSRMGVSFKRLSGKFAANPSVLDYLRVPVAKEKPRLCKTWVGLTVRRILGESSANKKLRIGNFRIAVSRVVNSPNHQWDQAIGDFFPHLDEVH